MLSFKNFLLGESLSYKDDYVIEDSLSKTLDESISSREAFLYYVFKILYTIKT